MRVGVLGAGAVGRTLATACVTHGHEVMLGARTPDAANVTEWQQATSGQIGSLAQAAGLGDIVFNALKGEVSLDVVSGLAAELAGKILVDVANPLDFSNGFPPSFTVSNTDSLGEQIQRALPDTSVVKALNTVNTSVMATPQVLAEPTDLFVCGNDAGAKEVITDLLVEFGWERGRIRDLGDITACRGTESYLALWVRTMSMLGSATFNVRVVTE